MRPKFVSAEPAGGPVVVREIEVRDAAVEGVAQHVALLLDRLGRRRSCARGRARSGAAAGRCDRSGGRASRRSGAGRERRSRPRRYPDRPGGLPPTHDDDTRDDRGPRGRRDDGLPDDAQPRAHRLHRARLEPLAGEDRAARRRPRRAVRDARRGHRRRVGRSSRCSATPTPCSRSWRATTARSRRPSEGAVWLQMSTIGLEGTAALHRARRAATACVRRRARARDQAARRAGRARHPRVGPRRPARAPGADLRRRRQADDVGRRRRRRHAAEDRRQHLDPVGRRGRGGDARARRGPRPRSVARARRRRRTARSTCPTCR